jgi:DNA invertase Pin-like site-specific DNA recombinase
MKCFAYLRVSSLGQTQGDGYDRQLAACEFYAAAHGYEIVEVFRDSITGKSELENRPALSDLLAALEENGIKTVICEKLDRMARDLMIQETIIADMQKKGYTLISTVEPDLCSQDPSRVLIRQIFGALAQWDRAMIVLKLRGARQRIKARTGKCEGRAEYGRKPGESTILSEMQTARRHGMSYDAIAAMLNATNTPTRYGKSWRSSTIAKILKRDLAA